MQKKFEKIRLVVFTAHSGGLSLCLCGALCTGGRAFLYPVPDGDGRRVGRTAKLCAGLLIRTVRFTKSDHTVLIFILWL